MAASNNWRDASTWRTNDSVPSTTNAPRAPYQGRLAASSWRTKDAASAPSDADPERQSRREPQRQQRGKWSVGSRPFDRERSITKPQTDESGAAQAIAEGRRIYIGNLRYQAKPDDIEKLLNDNELSNFESIHISIDHFTGRNPSYCFVEFPDKETAERAMETLEGKSLLGREVKCRPCIPKGGPSGGRQTANAGQDRWGRWPGEKANEGGPSSSAIADQSPDQAKGLPTDRYLKDFPGQRVYVGGLPRMNDQATNFAEISELFKDFQIDAISKRISAHESVRSKPGRHDFCFVDFATPEQARAAVEATNGCVFRGGRLTINIASKSRSNKWRERENLDGKNADEPTVQVE
ncbi:RNA-binding domain-containing protein [Jackrogersella minutella]|nr:RNA-binding domain-containing protein [Jackrogersella minutella]